MTSSYHKLGQFTVTGRRAQESVRGNDGSQLVMTLYGSGIRYCFIENDVVDEYCCCLYQSSFTKIKKILRPISVPRFHSHKFQSRQNFGMEMWILHVILDYKQSVGQISSKFVQQFLRDRLTNIQTFIEYFMFLLLV